MSPSSSHRRSPMRFDRRGITLLEVIVVIVLLGLLVLMTIFILPRRREVARLAGCRRNLAQIGVALALYDQSERALPTIPILAADPPSSGGPLWALLDSLSLPDLNTLAADKKVATRPRRPIGKPRPVLGFVCPSDRFPDDSIALPAPVSYRATTGDQTDGRDGGFAPGRAVRLIEIEAGDGQSFTAAFSERLLGSGRNGEPTAVNYMTTPRSVDARGCPAGGPSSWRGDAGRSWAEASWRSTLYNHARTPGAAPSCVSDDGLTALISASSGHIGGANVLMFDGSVRTVSPSIDPNIWKGMATTHATPPSSPPGAAIP